MKRGLASASATGEEEVTKYSKMGGSDFQDHSAIDPYLKNFDDVQAELQKLDEECAREQMNIQKKFDEKKKSWFEKRQGIIDKVPGFWCRTLHNHPALTFLLQEDIQILNHLKRIDLDDNIDDGGSYKVTFTFDEKAKEYFEPLKIVKHVKFDQEKDYVQECTEIKWKPGKNPIEKAMELRKADENCEEWSIFEWFTKHAEDDGLEDRIDVGEVIRRDIWHTPLPHYMGTAAAEDAEDDYEEEDDGDLDEEEAEDADEDDDGDDDEEDDN